MNIGEMKSEVYAWAVTKGWEPDQERTFGDECALLHSEISEVLEAYRIRRFAEYTTSDGKPDDVGSELADILVRLCHYSATGRFVLHGPPNSLRVISLDKHTTLGTWVAKMHLQVSKAYEAAEEIHDAEIRQAIINQRLNYLMHMCGSLCESNGLDLAAEFRRKMDYNYTRAWRHGNRAM